MRKVQCEAIRREVRGASRSGSDRECPGIIPRGLESHGAADRRVIGTRRRRAWGGGEVDRDGIGPRTRVALQSDRNDRLRFVLFDEEVVRRESQGRRTESIIVLDLPRRQRTIRSERSLLGGPGMRWRSNCGQRTGPRAPARRKRTDVRPSLGVHPGCPRPSRLSTRQSRNCRLEPWR